MTERNGTTVSGTCQSGDEGRMAVIPDGGQVFCVRCGDKMDSDVATCPTCGAHQNGNQAEDSNSNEPLKQDSDSRESLGIDSDIVPPDNTRTGDHDTERADDSADVPEVDEEYCSNCGEVIAKTASTCSYCGVERTSVPREDSKGVQRNPAFAGILSFVIIGAGQFYNGQMKRAFRFFGVAVLAVIVATEVPALGVLVLLSVWGYAIYDAINRARLINSI